MAVSIGRIILCSIIFTDKRISCQIQKQPRLLLSKIFFQDLRQFISIQDLLDHQKSPYPQTTASRLSGFLFRHLLTAKILYKSFIWEHSIRVIFWSFSNDPLLRNIIFFLWMIYSFEHISDVYRTPFFHIIYLSGYLRNVYLKIQIHGISPFKHWVLLSTQYFTPDSPFFQDFLPKNPYFSRFFTIRHFLSVTFSGS